MKITRPAVLFIGILFSGQIFAQQESISPLIQNQELNQKSKQARANDIYVYEIDTLSIATGPFIDDFSINKFRQFDAQPGDPNVTSQEYFRLMQGPTPMHDTTQLMTDTTYSYLIDTTANGQDTIISITPLPSMTITVNDLSSYPVNSTSTTVWPRYNVIDTVYKPSSPDTLYLTPDLIQDSVTVYFVASDDTLSALWIDNFAYFNYRYATNPPTLGVATFDGLDQNGYPYNFLVQTSQGVADYLTSKPINLFYPAGDSIYLSFFYQPEGLGDQPESGDSLTVEFYSPVTDSWNNVWSVPGSAGHEFKQVLIPITNSIYLQNAFQFRFKNRATLSGSLDHWHIDYVLLDRFRTSTDTIRDDVAFRYQPVTLLKEYSSVPWHHYMDDPASYMRDTITVFQRNNNNAGRLVGNNEMRIYHEGALQETIFNLNTPSIPGFTDFKTLYNVGLWPYEYDTAVADTSAYFEIEVNHRTTPDELRDNDTTRFTQVFENYYAYDDGSAEAAYGPNALNAKLAYKFTTAVTDTLRSVQIYFAPSVDDVSDKTFILTLWDANGAGGKPGNIIYQNNAYSFPVYTNERNGFYEYHLETPQVIGGTFYVGWAQQAEDKLNVGLDLNVNSQSKIYYNVGGSWIQTSFAASLMIRPVFKSKLDYLLGVPQASVPEKENHTITLYPNPANGILYIRSDEEISSTEIFDATGRMVYHGNYSGGIDVTMLEPGMYVLRANIHQSVVTSRFIISR